MLSITHWWSQGFHESIIEATKQASKISASGNLETFHIYAATVGWTHFPVFWFLYSWWEDYVQFCCNFRWPDAFSLALLRSSPVSISFHIHSLGLCIFFTNCYINPTYSTIIVSLRAYLMVSFPRPKQISFGFLDSALLSMVVDWGDCSLLPWWGPPISGTAELQLFWGLNWKHDYFLDFWWRKMASVVSFQSPGLLWCYAFFSAATLHSGMCVSGSVVSLANFLKKNKIKWWTHSWSSQFLQLFT